MSKCDDGLTAGPSSAKPDRRIIVTALGITQIFAWGSTFYLLGVLAVPIAGDTGWPVDWVMGGISIGLLVAGLILPHVGRTIGDRGGGLVLAAGAVLLAMGLLVLAFAQNLFAYLGAWLIIGAGMSASLYDAAFATLGSIYGKESRGAITAVTLFGGFASTVCWPLSAYLVEHLGWRETCLVYAAIQIGFAVPLHLLVVPRRSFVMTDRTRTQGPARSALSPHETRFLRCSRPCSRSVLQSCRWWERSSSRCCRHVEPISALP